MKHNVCYSFDKNFIGQGMTSIKSLIENNINLSLDIYILELGMGKEDKDCLSGLEDERHRILVIDAEDRLGRMDKIDAGEWNRMTLVRLVMEDVLPKSIDWVLYLDADTVVNGSLDVIFSMDIGECWGAAVLDKYIAKGEKTRIGLKETSPYFNAGVLYVNLKKWREHGVGNQCIEYLANNPGWNTMPDQNALNKVLEGHIKLLPLSCNVDGYTFLLPYGCGEKIFKEDISKYYSEKDYEMARSRPVISHFIGWYLDKPWIEGNLQPMAPVWDAYAKKAGVELEKQSRRKYKGFIRGFIRNRARRGIQKSIEQKDPGETVRVYLRAQKCLEYGSKIKGKVKK